MEHDTAQTNPTTVRLPMGAARLLWGVYRIVARIYDQIHQLPAGAWSRYIRSGDTFRVVPKGVNG